MVGSSSRYFTCISDGGKNNLKVTKERNNTVWLGIIFCVGNIPMFWWVLCIFQIKTTHRHVLCSSIFYLNGLRSFYLLCYNFFFEFLIYFYWKVFLKIYALFKFNQRNLIIIKVKRNNRTWMYLHDLHFWMFQSLLFATLVIYAFIFRNLNVVEMIYI